MKAESIHRGLLALATVCSGVVVAFAFEPVPHAGGDNSGYIALAHDLLTAGTYTDAFDPERLPHTKYPPVFPALLAGLMALGARSWTVLKMTAVMPTVATVALTYLLAARSLGSATAIAVALLLALSSGVVYYSHWVLSDPLFVALTIGSLYALARFEPDVAPEAEVTDAPGPGRRKATWLAIGVAAAGLAYFTRSAGLPLVVAVLAWLAIRRRWFALGSSAVALGIPMALWWLRGRGDGVAQYATEFWMIDPYQPRLGTIAVFGLVPRVLENLGAYVLQHLPAGVVGADGPALAGIGLALTGLSIAGWILAARKRLGPMELFFPLYAGLILLWPAVWGGDRFALPLFPLIFLYAAWSVRAVAEAVPPMVGSAAAAILLLFLMLPAAGNWLDMSRQSRVCVDLAVRNGVWACYGPRVGYYVMAASWTASGLPEGSAVLSRKPRHFYLLSGHPSRAFVFEESASAQLDLADALGARYVLLDQWDGLAGRYVGAAVREQPGAFCFVRGFGSVEEGGAQLLGILPPAMRRPAGSAGASVDTCPDGYYGPNPPQDYSSSERIPLLEGLDS